MSVKQIEDKAVYITDFPCVRNECFTNFSNWLEPTAAEIRYMLERANLKQTELAKILGVDPRTVRRWALGEIKISYLAWCVVCSYCGIKELWKR